MTIGMPEHAARSAAVAAPAFGTWAGLSYGALGLPLAFVALPLYVVLPSHYVARHGVPLATLGMVLLATRALDAVLDPFIGRAADAVFARSAAAAWAAAALAALLMAIGFAALFHAPLEGNALLAWLASGLVVTYLSFSVLTVVHQAWGTRLGGDASQRSRVVAWREGCGLAGVLAASVLPLQFGVDVASFALAVTLAIGIGLLALAPRTAARRHASPAAWTLPWRSTSFRALLTVFMLNGIASAVPATLVLFFVRDRLQVANAEALFLGAYFAAAALSVPLWVRAVRAWGLVPAWLGGMGLAVAAFAWALTLGPGDRTGFVAVCIVSGIALGADLTVPGALLTGVIQRAGHAGRADGVYVGWWTCATKLNLALAAGAALPLLSLAGYAPGLRDPAALRALGLAYVAVPCLLKLVAAGLLYRSWIMKEVDE
ncbi:MAG TPA: MFS transporter [Burkholderiaceae bacterium]